MDRRSFLRRSAALAAGGAAGTGWLERLAAQSPLASAAEMPLGLVVHHLDAGTLDQVRRLHVRYLRFTVYWQLWGDAAYRRKIAAGLDRAAGFDLLLVLHGQGDDLRDFVRFVGEVARLAPHAAIQPWNEVDTRFPGSERFDADPRRYTRHLADIRAAVPNTRLVSAGLASGGDTLRRWVAALDDSPVDVVAVHTYGWPILATYREKSAIARQETDRPVWNTEFGLEKAVIPPDLRGDWERLQEQAIAECVVEDGLYERAYLYVLQDEHPEGHSIIRPDGSLRPAAVWIRDRG